MTDTTIRKPPARSCGQTLTLLEKASLEEVSGLSKDRIVAMWLRMSLIREFEERAASLYRSGRIRGVTHTYQGQEAVAVGATWCLTSEDLITSTHRGHGHILAKGGDEKICMAELMGKETGYCRGRGGSMHIADMTKGILGANGIVGGGMGIAVGSALASKMLGNGRVTVCFFGDGALNEGLLHEVSNLAAIWKLPCVFLCENNLYGMSGPVDQMLALGAEGFLGRPAAYGIPGSECDGMDVIDVFLRVKEAVQRARTGQGPSYVVAHTYRFLGHHVGDPLSYRAKEEVELWREKDPIPNFGRLLVAQGLASETDLEALAREARAAIETAIAFAEASPEASVETIMDGVFG
jgi:TPP-dependent pyruvate/acetoin dehydrogenase alpha subunit